MISIEKINQDVSNAYDLLKLVFGVKELSDIETPIDVDYIISRIENLKYSNESSFDDWENSGYIQVQRDKQDNLVNIHLWTNPSELKVRQRFTKAHELGHLVHDIAPFINDLSEGEGKFIDKLNRDGSDNPIERRANKFAAQLLMPLDLMKLEIERLSNQIQKENKKVPVSEVIDKLASVFGVSSIAMEYRLKNLGYIK